MLESGIRNLPTETLFHVIQDAQARLGSHIGMSEEPVTEYVVKQRHIIDLVRDELEQRKSPLGKADS